MQSIPTILNFVVLFFDIAFTNNTVYVIIILIIGFLPKCKEKIMLNIIPKPNKAVELGGKIALGKLNDGGFKNAAAIYNKAFCSTDGASVTITTDKTMSKNSYKIECADNAVNITVADENGAIYAIQTLRQLNTDGSIPKVIIDDKPQYEWRAFMLDSARHFWTVEHVKEILELMSNLKLNVFHWHLTDDQGWRIEIKKYPELTEIGSVRRETQLRVINPKYDGKEYGKGLYYTQEQIKDVIAYAKKLGIDIVPEIDMPGHLIAVLTCFPELSCEGKKIEVSTKWGVMDTIGCCGNDDFYKFVEDILDEVTDLFPFEYFHIGGDEVPKTKWKSCPKCQAKIKELGLNNENELQGYFNNYVMKFVAKKGKKLIGWNEILDASTLDKNTIIQWWTPTHGKALALKWLASGGKAILSRHTEVYMDHSYEVRPLKKQYFFNYKQLGIKDPTNVIGIEAPQWTEYISERGKFDFCTYPRLMALSEAAWTNDSIRNDYRGFEDRLENMREYFEKTYNIKMADQFSYRGNHLGFFLYRPLKAWKRWHNDPFREYNTAMAKNKTN